ncbi:forkhead box protein N1 isoform X2 [Solea solea]|uniref:forkhead box protein N1 isoform X2 n=1 Tax=Solea solea TaxID=90069 RepID=UPI00272A80D4|nr:forkhead box protein N1 isoform X2 [Solea solea]
MSDSSTGGKSQTSSLQAKLHTCEPCGSCQQMAESPDTFSLRTAAVNRRHSADDAVGSRSGSLPGRGTVDPERFHPYHRQFRDGAADCLQQCSSSSSSSSFSCMQEGFSPDTSLQSSSSEAPHSWDQYNGSIQTSYPEPPAVLVEPTCFLSQSYPSYSSSSSLNQVSSRLYSNNDRSKTPKYTLSNLSTHSHQDTTTEPLFPKPIYSYSILIFMALKSSKTGSLPVSEIYSFMTEHFPYFKTAPDGWKNSVRHNLSLNKCFEKVENKNGNSSRKGCLWALNPAKVGKMQEELHKWRRKDPIMVRRSMARPEDLETLVGERPDKLRSLPPYTGSSLLSRVTSCYGTSLSPCSPAPLRASCQTVHHSEFTHMLPQTPCYLPPTIAHPSNSFSLCSPCGHLLAPGVPSAPGGLNSSTAGKMPQVYTSALQTKCRVGIRSMQDLLLEGDAIYDIDTFNPSLTDLQLQGNIWEELREDSLVSDPHLSSPSALQDPHMQTGCLPPVSHTSEDTTVGQCKEQDDDDKDACWGQNVEQHGCLNGLHPVVYSGMDNFPGYLTSCSTSISLI